MSTISQNNRLVKKTILKSYLPCFLIALVFSLALLVDVILASSLVAPDASSFVGGVTGFEGQYPVAAIGVAFPVSALAASFLLAFVQGTAIKYNDALARGYKDECSRIFSKGFWTVLLLGIALSVLNFFIADWIVYPFGAENKEVVYFAAMYLKLSGFAYTFAALNRLYVNTMGVYGHYKTAFFSNIINIVVNIVSSIIFYKTLGHVEMPFLFVYGLPSGFQPVLGIGALALGTCTAEIVTFMFNAIAKNIYKIEAKLRFVSPSFKSFINTFTRGFPVVASIFIESLIAGLINIIIVKAYWGSPLASSTASHGIGATSALTIYTVVRSFWQLSQVSSQAMGLATIPMVGLFYGAKDKEAVKSVWKSGLHAGMLFTLGWALFLLCLSPLIMRAYGSGIESLHTNIEWGVLCVLPCSVFFTCIYMLQIFFAVTNRKLSSILVSAIPEAVIFPALLVLLLNVVPIGDNKLFLIWGCMGLNSLLFFLVAYIGNAIKTKSMKINADKLLQLDKGQCKQIPAFDVSVNTLEEVSQLAETIQKWLKDSEATDRTSFFTALAVDEISNDIMKRGNYKLKKLPENVSYLDIKLMSEKEYVRIVIRDAGDVYNPLDYDQLVDNAAKVGVRAVQQMASYIHYQRLYKMNIITIDIMK